MTDILTRWLALARWSERLQAQRAKLPNNASPNQPIDDHVLYVQMLHSNSILRCSLHKWKCVMPWIINELNSNFNFNRWHFNPMEIQQFFQNSEFLFVCLFAQMEFYSLRYLHCNHTVKLVFWKWQSVAIRFTSSNLHRRKQLASTKRKQLSFLEMGWKKAFSLW